MYLVRSLALPRVLSVELSGALDDIEALRLLSQVAALADADGGQPVLCDTRQLTFGPSDVTALVASLSVAAAAIHRLLLVATPEQEAMLRRIAHRARILDITSFHTTVEDALAALNRAAHHTAQSSTAAWHLALFANGTPVTSRRRAPRHTTVA